MIIKEQLAKAITLLNKITESSRLEAEILLASCLKKSRNHLLAWPEQSLSVEVVNQFHQLIQRRLLGEPVAYLLGEKEFWSLSLLVNEHTLIPRPETELIVEKALTLFAAEQNIKVADLRTGSGAIALAIAHEQRNWQVYATDISKGALTIAGKNAQRLGLKNLSFFHGDWCNALLQKDFDLIVSNPPYIANDEWQRYESGLKYEPKSALLSGKDGLDAIRIISHSAKSYLKEGGCLLIEHGFQQGPDVRAYLSLQGYGQILTYRDLSGRERVTFAQKSTTLFAK